MYDARLQTFITVVERGSFTAASKVLFISPVAIKKQIDSFEEDLGLILFKRSNQGVEMTDSGEIIYHEGKMILEQCRKVIEKAHNAGNAFSLISIGYTISETETLTSDFWGVSWNNIRNIEFVL